MKEINFENAKVGDMIYNMDIPMTIVRIVPTDIFPIKVQKRGNAGVDSCTIDGKQFYFEAPRTFFWQPVSITPPEKPTSITYPRYFVFKHDYWGNRYWRFDSDTDKGTFVMSRMCDDMTIAPSAYNLNQAITLMDEITKEEAEKIVPPIAPPIAKPFPRYFANKSKNYVWIMDSENSGKFLLSDGTWIPSVFTISELASEELEVTCEEAHAIIEAYRNATKLPKIEIEMKVKVPESPAWITLDFDINPDGTITTR